MYNFNEKVVLVTGASSGIGRSTAELFVKHGAKVVLNYLSNEEGVNEAVETIRKANGECIAIQADVTNKAEVDQMFEKAIESYGKLDILVNNAGAAVKRSSYMDITEELFDKTMDVNVKSVLFCSQAALKYMLPKEQGKIINVSSLVAKSGGPKESVHYASAKGAVNTMTIGMAKEFVSKGIIVNGVAPGFIDTPFQRTKFSTPERIEKVVPRIPLKRMGTPEEVAETIVFLASDAANYIVGEIIAIGGGH